MIMLDPAIAAADCLARDLDQIVSLIAADAGKSSSAEPAMDELTRQQVLDAWKARPFVLNYPPARESDLVNFEKRFEPIPADVRWFLANCGGGIVGELWLDCISELMQSHAQLREEWDAAKANFRNQVFVIGRDANEHPFGIERTTGRIVLDDTDFDVVRELAESLGEFLRNRIIESDDNASGKS